VRGLIYKPEYVLPFLVKEIEYTLHVQ
jgi:hypothetical protein